jgi:hypothetical protein
MCLLRACMSIVGICTPACRQLSMYATHYLPLRHMLRSCCLQEDGSEEADRLLTAGADRVVDEDGEHAAGAALAVDEEDDVATARTATGRHTNATEEVCLNLEVHSAKFRVSNRLCTASM